MGGIGGGYARGVLHLLRLLPLALSLSALLACGGGPEADAGAARESTGQEPAAEEELTDVHGGVRRNVLFIAIDDLRPALGAYGDELARTPHLDGLAAQSLVFLQHHVQQPLCNPSRASLLTGRRPRTSGVTGLRDHYRETMPEVVSLPEHFRQRGYTTLSLGKIHHGRGALDDPRAWSEPPWRPDEREHYHTEEARRREAERKAELAGTPFQRYARGPAVEAPDLEGEELLDGQVASEALRRLEQLAGEDAPFFLAVGIHKPHLPFVAPLECWQRHAREAFRPEGLPPLPAGAPPFAGIGVGELVGYHGLPRELPLQDGLAGELRHGYYAAVSHADDQVGRILEGLEELGLDEDTLVVVWGDHGFHLGEQELWCKQTNFELATRSPLMVRVPPAWGLEAEPARSEALVETVDVYPSLAELCGLPAPEGVEGTSFVPLLAEPERPWKRAVFSENPRSPRGAGQEVLGTSMRTARYRLTLWQAGGEDLGVELYDLQDGALESLNVAGDPAYGAVLEELLPALREGWRGALPETD